MLSKHSFNALLKTLEEPPPHVKFLLATTDPQKLPVTILSRCLQFNLKALSREQIAQQLSFVLQQEKITFDNQAIAQLARAAQGSMRDALSLTDQAIAQGNGEISQQIVTDMLGLMDKGQIVKLVASVFKNDAHDVINQVEQISQQAPDYGQVLAEIMSLLHQVALTQFVPEACKLETVTARAVYQLSKMLPPEQVQLAYQIALKGKRDIHFAADGRIGLEMTLLRMLAFNPTPIDISINSTAELAAQQDLPHRAKVNEEPTKESVAAEESIPVERSHIVEEDEDNHFAQQLDAQQQDIERQASEQKFGVPYANEEVAADAILMAFEEDRRQTHGQMYDSTYDHEEVASNAILMAFEGNNDHSIDSNLSITEEFNTQQNQFDSATVGQFELDANEQSDAHVPVAALGATESLIALKNKLAQSQHKQEEQTSPVKKSEDRGSLRSDFSPLKSVTPVSQPPIQDSQTELEPNLHEEQPIEVLPEVDQSWIENTPDSDMPYASTKVLQSEELPPWPTDAQLSQEDVVTPSFDPNEHLNEQQEVEVDFEVPAFLPSGEKVLAAMQLDTWSQLIEQMQVTALTKQLALHSAYEKSGPLVTLKLLDSKPHLNTESARAQLQQALSEALQQEITLNVELTKPINTPFAVQQKINQVRLEHAHHVIEHDDNIVRLKDTFSAKVLQDSVKPR